MDELRAQNERLSADLVKCQKLNELLLKYRLYFKDYLKLCKCKQTVDQSLIVLITEELDEEFEEFQGDGRHVDSEPIFSAETSGEDIDTKSDDIQEVHSSSESTDKHEIPSIIVKTNVTFVCLQIGCNLAFDSKDSLDRHSEICPKKPKLYHCPECGASFETSLKLKGHQSIHRTNAAQIKGQFKSFICEEMGCNKQFERKSLLKVHISRKHKQIEPILKYKKPFICNWVGCGHKTANRQDLSLHIRRKHTLEKPFKCDECHKSYELEKLLKNHQKIHSNFRYNCDFDECQYKTPHIWELKTHIKNKHLNEQRFECDVEGCHKSYKYEGDLKAHNREFHLNIKSYECEWPGCQSRFSRLESLKNHILRHKNERQFKCEVEGCGKAFNTRKELKTHSTLHDGTMYKFPCEWPGCTRMLASRCHTKEHINSFHLKIRAFKCDECDKSFTLKDTLRTHKLNAHSEDSPKKEKKEHKCDECLRVFNSMKNLNNHQKSVHSSEPLFSCDWTQCEERFKTSHALTAHRAVHMDGGEYKCCAINCGKSFTTRETLLSHELIHNKRFACSWPGCAKRFAKNFLLTHHMKRHQNIREFKCEVEGCGLSFVTKTHLDHHLDKHSNPLPFKCVENGCERGFTRKSSLQNHIEKVHHAIP